MAAAFNVQDITNISQLSYTLYNGDILNWTSVSRDHEELKNELFALHCASGHLARLANLESSKLFDKTASDNRTPQPWQMLDELVAECATTLRELENATNEHGERAEQLTCIFHQPNIGGKSPVKSAVTVLEEPEQDANRVIKCYRDRLRSHSDAINLVLNVFYRVLQKHRDIGDEENIQAMQELQQRVTNSNSELIPLVKELLARFETLSVNHYGNAEVSGGYVHQGDQIVYYYFGNSESLPDDFQARPHIKPRPQRDTTTGAGKRLGIHASPMGQSAGLSPLSVGSSETYEAGQRSSGTAPMSLMSRAPTMGSSSDGPRHLRHVRPTSSQQEESHVSNNVPPAIMQLNLRRQQAGIREFADFKHSSFPTSMPLFTSHEVPTVKELGQGLQYIFSSTRPRFGCQHNPKMRLRASEIERWTQGLSNSLQIHNQSILSAKESAQSMSAEQQTSYVGLLSSLNETLESTGTELRTSFYDTSSAAGIEKVFDRLLTLTKSVRIEKEVSEFHDEREDFGWKARR